MVVVGTGGAKSRIVRHDYPYDEGLELGTTKLKETDFALEPEEDLTLKKNKELL